jgi:hypothetical protein
MHKNYQWLINIACLTWFKKCHHDLWIYQDMYIACQIWCPFKGLLLLTKCLHSRLHVYIVSQIWLSVVEHVLFNEAWYRNTLPCTLITLSGVCSSIHLFFKFSEITDNVFYFGLQWFSWSYFIVRFDGLIKITVHRNVMPYSFVCKYQRFEGLCYAIFRLQDKGSGNSDSFSNILPSKF